MYVQDAAAQRRVDVRTLLLALVAVGLIGCRAPARAAPPTPEVIATAASGAQSQPAGNLAPSAPVDIETAFLSNVDDLIAEANDLTATPCPDLTQVTRDHPTLLPSLRGFAASMKRASGARADLDTDNVKVAVGDLDHTMGALEAALSTCGITQP